MQRHGSAAKSLQAKAVRLQKTLNVSCDSAAPGLYVKETANIVTRVVVGHDVAERVGDTGCHTCLGLIISHIFRVLGFRAIYKTP